MLLRLLIRVGAISCSLLVAHRAEAACEITDVAPTGVIPTTTTGPQFSFVATMDCTDLTFESIVGSYEYPGPGVLLDSDHRLFRASLTAAQWHALAISDAITFRWTVSGKGPRSFTHVTTVNELDIDGDGWTRSEGDVAACDLRPASNPAADEVCDNGIDDDCDGIVDQCTLPIEQADVLIEGEHPTTSYYYGIGGVMDVADLDSDGVADVLLGDPAVGLAHILYGPISGVIGSDAGATLSAHDPGAASFGAGMDAGDVDGDGIADVVVGAPGRNTAYLFLGPISASRTTYGADAHLIGRDESHRDYTGGSILVGLDHDGDGQGDVVVGGHDYKADAAGGHTRGAVYVASGSVSGDIELETSASYVYLGAWGTDEFGTRVETVGDWNGDGIDELAVSALRAGSVYVIEGGGRPGRFYVQDVASATIGPEKETVDFGTSLAAGDYDGDGTPDLFVGEPKVMDPPGTFLGRVFCFSRPISGTIRATEADTTWEGEQGTHGSWLGQDIALGDADGDGATDVLMGDWYGGPASGGGVYLQLGRVSGTVSVEDHTTFTSREFIGLGDGVDFVPDWTGDGGDEILFGAPRNENDAGESIGGAYVFFSDSLF